ncbi:MAG: NUDIX hydrolase [Candidatus Competibacterales bacterium]|nr:NUDIX hydrolase [Candidatus Competibacterales bacterium]
MAYTYDYPRPAVTVDVVLFTLQTRRLRVLLIQRRAPPFEGCWALPGGFMDLDEELPAAARRELREETGLRIRRLQPLGAYGRIGRDPRGRTISVVYLAFRPDAAVRARAGDDAREVGWFSPRRPPELAFDHRDILRDGLRMLRELAGEPVRFFDRFGLRDLSGDQQRDVLQAVRGRRTRIPE